MNGEFLERLRESLDYNPETGEFHWKVAVARRTRVGSLAGHVNKFSGYLQIRVGYSLYYAHRLAWLLTYGEWPEGVIDHADGNCLNNRVDNLRDVSQMVNTQNHQEANSNNKVGLLGVSFNKASGRFVARIWCDGKNKHLGYFTTPEEAHAAYLVAKRELHEGCTI